MKELFDKIVAYFQDNPIYFYIAVVIAVLIVVVIIAMIILGVKRSKAKKAAAADAESAKPAVPAESKANIAAAGKPSESTLSETNISKERATEPQAKPVSPVYRYEEKQENASAPSTAESQPELTTIRSAAPQNKTDIPAADAAQDDAVQTNEPKPNQEQAAVPAQKADAPAASDVSGSATPAQERVKVAEPKARQTERQPNASRKRAAEKQNAAPAEQAVSNVDGARPHDAEEEKRPAYSGKWVISKNEDTGLYSFELRASNGEKLLGSIEYTSVSGAKNGIKTHKNNIAKGNIVISQNKKGQYFFRLLNGSKQLLCTGETYPTKAGCESAVESVKRFAETAVITVKDEQEEE